VRRSAWNAVWAGLTVWLPWAVTRGVEFAAAFAIGVLQTAAQAPLQFLWGASHNLAKTSAVSVFIANWARFTFEQSGVPYTSIHKDDLRRGGLRRRFDVIVVPNTGGSAADFIHEYDRKWGPMPYTQTPEFPSHGTPSSTDDMTGGPGFRGVAELERFAEEGGLIVTIETATRMVAETGIARVLEPVSTRTLFHPGSVVRAREVPK